MSRPAPEPGLPAAHDGRIPGTSLFDLVDAQFRNAAAAGKVRRLVLEFAPAVDIAAACACIFERVDRDDEMQRAVARNAWLIKATVLQTLLSFDDPRLGLEPLAQAMREAADVIPAISTHALALGNLVTRLLSAPRNPKRERFLQLPDMASAGAAPMAVLAGLQGVASPGWPADLSCGTDLGGEELQVLRARKDLRGRVFSRIVIPGSPRMAARPFLHDVLFGGRAAELVLLSYRGERVHLPQPLALPADSTFRRSTPRVERQPDLVEGGPETQLDRWISDSFWERIRAQHADSEPVSERDLKALARFVLFADGSGAFLPEDGRVVEISDLLDTGGSLDVAEERLPRKAVRDLEERDLVMLRLGGSGDYLDDVANDMMQKAGLGSLHHDAVEWKAWLHRAIRQHGEGVVARVAREFGLRLRSPGYLWVWAGDMVMAPHDLGTFRKLIGAIAGLDGSMSQSDADAYATEKWHRMEQVKTFHTRAGMTIRAALLERVRSLVAARHRVDAACSIELPGVEAGSMGLLRVAAVDGTPVRVPLSRLYHIKAVKEAGWHG